MYQHRNEANQEQALHFQTPMKARMKGCFRKKERIKEREGKKNRKKDGE